MAKTNPSTKTERVIAGSAEDQKIREGHHVLYLANSKEEGVEGAISFETTYCIETPNPTNCDLCSWRTHCPFREVSF